MILGGYCMSKWEDKYNELSPKIDDMIKEQSNKINEISREKAKFANDINSKEYRKLRDELNSARKEKQRLEKVKPNLKQIANIIEYRETLKKALDRLKKETEIRADLKHATEEQKRLESEIIEYQNSYEKISKELKNKDLKDEQRKQLEDKIKEIKEKMPMAQEDRDKYEGILRQGLDRKTKFSELSQEEIDSKSIKIQNTISKCNLVARNLLEGASWDSINMKLDDWKDKRFTAKDDKLSKAKENSKKDVDKSSEKAPEKDPEKTPEQKTGMGSEMGNGDNGINAGFPVVKRTFADRHPRLAKIFSKIKNIFFKSKKSNIKKLQDEIQKEIKTVEERQDEMEREKIAENVKEIMEEKEKQKPESSKESAFKEYIKQIAEKGMDEVKKERQEAKAKEEMAQRQAREKEEKAKKEARTKIARGKLAEMQKANRAREEKKFGKDYADRSRTDDGSR